MTVSLGHPVHSSAGAALSGGGVGSPAAARGGAVHPKRGAVPRGSPAAQPRGVKRSAKWVRRAFSLWVVVVVVFFFGGGAGWRVFFLLFLLFFWGGNVFLLCLCFLLCLPFFGGGANSPTAQQPSKSKTAHSSTAYRTQPQQRSSFLLSFFLSFLGGEWGGAHVFGYP